VQDLVNYLADSNEQESQYWQQASVLDLLMIFGGDTLTGLQRMCALYFEELVERGVKIIVITGGIGRLTGNIVNDTISRIHEGTFPSLTIRHNKNITSFIFGTTGKFIGREKAKPLQTGAFDLNASKETVLSFVSEGDIYLEWLLHMFLQQGYTSDDIAILGYDDYQRGPNGLLVVDEQTTAFCRKEQLIEPESSIYVLRPESAARIVRANQQQRILIFVENASTNTGNNVRYSLEMLITAGQITTPEDAQRIARRTLVYQQPALQLRSKYTVGKQFGALPLSFSYAPQYQTMTWSEKAKTLGLIAGEYLRIASYSQEPFNFFTRPEGFDENVVAFFREDSEILQM
jgi:hypothetical protein